MKALRVCFSTSMLILLSLFLCLQVPGAARAGTAGGDRVLTGELVVTNAARNQFRLVEHSGSFTAPAGTAVTEFDGKPVRVEFGSDGRALQITQMPIDYAPITHGFEVISGELVLRDPVMRTFGIVGDDRTYVAPQGIDAGQYAGRLVQLRLDEQGQVMNINLISRAADAPLSPSPSKCLFGDASISDGASICRSGVLFRCTDGQWVRLGGPCT